MLGTAGLVRQPRWAHSEQKATTTVMRPRQQMEVPADRAGSSSFSSSMKRLWWVLSWKYR